MGFTLRVKPPARSKSEDTIRAYYRYVEQKYEIYCNDPRSIDIQNQLETSLNLYGDGRFYIGKRIVDEVHRRIAWDDLIDPSGDWVLTEDQAIERVVEELEDASEAANADNDDYDYVCFTQAGPIAICEFALERGYAVDILDD